MADKVGSSIIRQLRFVVASWKEDPRTDVELLRRFVHTRDEQAFTTLVGRHSELVWGTCLRVLRNPTDAEDALQAAFLRLAREAKRIGSSDVLAAWLYRVARDCAIDLQRSILRQRRIEARVAEVAQQPGDSGPSSDLRVLLDDELAQLPHSERTVLILCCLEGRTYADAAQELGCSTAAVHRRFLRAQLRLRRRFARHGRTGVASAALLTAALPASAAPPAALARTVATGLAVARGGTLPPTRAGELAASATTSATTHASAAVAALAFIAVAIGSAIAVFSQPGTPQQVAARDPVTHAGTDPAPPVGAPAPHTTIAGTVRGAAGEPVPNASVVALARRPFGPGERGMRDEVLATALSDSAGRFRFDLPDRADLWLTGHVVTVRASEPNRAPATLMVRLGGATGEANLTLQPATPLRGKLLDARGRPAGGVRVEVVRAGDAVTEPVLGAAPAGPSAWPSPTTTAPDGTFVFPALGGTSNVWVRVDDPRFALDTFRVDDGGDEFRLAPVRPLAVAVRAADTRAPVAGARVTVITDRVAAHPHFSAADHAARGPRSVPADIEAVANGRGLVKIGLAPDDRAEVLVVPPPGDIPYVGVRARAEVHAGSEEAQLVVNLPRGRWLTGTVTDAAGKPLAGAAVHWGRETATLPEWRDEVLVGRDALVRTAADGTFRIAVLPGACTLRVYGPALDFPAVFTKLPGTANTTLFAHHIARIDVPVNGPIAPVRLSLGAVAPVRGTVDHPTAGSGAAFVLASGRVSPVRGYSALPLPVRDGTFSVPGCRPERTTRAYLLDPVARVGAVVDVTPGTAAPRAKLLACGTLRVRFVDGAGRPKAGQDVSVALLVERDRAAGETALADPQPVEWFDAVNYPARPRTGPDGALVLPALVPGARYAVSVGSGANKVAVGTFMLEPGQALTIPDVTVPEGDPK